MKNIFNEMISKKYFLKLASAQQLAIKLHDLTCKSNHTDGCGWYYEISKGSHNWTGHTHQRYLGEILEDFENYKDYINALSLADFYKKKIEEVKNAKV